MVIGAGKYGPYVMHERKYVSLPKTENPLTVTLDTAIELINAKRRQETQRHIKAFDEEPKLEVMNGRYGPYLAYDGKNYRLPKNMHDKAAELTLEECMNVIQSSKKK